jgi:hypothetical protein
MDFLNKVTGSGNNAGNNAEGNQSSGSNSINENPSGGFMGKMNNMAGGGASGEKDEDMLDKCQFFFFLSLPLLDLESLFSCDMLMCGVLAVDFIQEKFMGQGDQSNESAAEQAKDEAMSDFIRDKYQDTTGSDFPIKDKEKHYGS